MLSRVSGRGGRGMGFVGQIFFPGAGDGSGYSYIKIGKNKYIQGNLYSHMKTWIKHAYKHYRTLTYNFCVK